MVLLLLVLTVEQVALAAVVVVVVNQLRQADSVLVVQAVSLFGTKQLGEINDY
jgi:hypothetical protein